MLVTPKRTAKFPSGVGEVGKDHSLAGLELLE
jgi:hypothetical protein